MTGRFLRESPACLPVVREQDTTRMAKLRPQQSEGAESRLPRHDGPGHAHTISPTLRRWFVVIAALVVLPWLFVGATLLWQPHQVVTSAAPPAPLAPSVLDPFTGPA